jgi:hypothetical protein
MRGKIYAPIDPEFQLGQRGADLLLSFMDPPRRFLKFCDIVALAFVVASALLR